MSKKDELTYDLFMLVDNIQEATILRFVTDVLEVAPKSFWKRGASRRHHLEDERGELGNLLHTIRVVKLTNIICDIINCSKISRDITLAAAVLHDMCRYGLDGKASSSVPEHPYLVRQLADKHNVMCPHKDQILAVIESHMGRWGEPPMHFDLSNKVILHLADCMVARALEVL